ncbi:MAG TPA: dTDP-4-dehydrorhamnose reductase [Dongiaceae bacterium]|nr:dTDP-4-dehydrorhamnose reductase [Dongiaceae bacterium]
MPRILVIGETGQLARSLGGLRWPAGLDLAFVGRRHLPESAPAAIRAALEAGKPALVLNTAAYTAVDRAESEPAAAAALNASLPRALAGSCTALDIPLVHVSTDYVFDGEKRSPYLETDAPNPLSVYGATKLEGDRAIEQAAPRRWAILRTSWLVSELGETFPVKLLRRAKAGEPLRVVDDQWGCPTAAADLARAMQTVGTRLLDNDAASSGLFNFRGASEMSWHGFADKLLNAAEQAGLKRPPLHAVKTADLNAPAKRPAYSVLSCARIGQTLSTSGRAIESDLDRMVRTVLSS